MWKQGRHVAGRDLAEMACFLQLEVFQETTPEGGQMIGDHKVNGTMAEVWRPCAKELLPTGRQARSWD